MTELSFVLIELTIEGNSSLAILMHNDGTINRQGDGTLNIDKNVYMGITDTSTILKKLTKEIDPEFEEYLNNVYDLPDKQGKNCSLEIKFADGRGMYGIRFSYGADSMGPPGSVSNFVQKAIELTNPWFHTSKGSHKKWWQFWK